MAIERGNCPTCGTPIQTAHYQAFTKAGDIINVCGNKMCAVKEAKKRGVLIERFWHTTRNPVSSFFHL